LNFADVAGAGLEVARLLIALADVFLFRLLLVANGAGRVRGDLFCANAR
jgi:hypothetical protein